MKESLPSVKKIDNHLANTTVKNVGDSLAAALTQLRASHTKFFCDEIRHQVKKLLEAADSGLLATYKLAHAKNMHTFLSSTNFLTKWENAAHGVPGEDDLAGLVRVSDEYFHKTPIREDQVAMKAESIVNSIHSTFIGKIVQKLSPIIKERNQRDSHGVSRFEIRSLSINSGTLEGILDFTFQDGDRFSVWNSVVTVWEAAAPFHRFPTTFHDISLAEKKVKSEALAWMVIVFAKGDSEEAYEEARRNGLREADFLEAFTVEGEGVLSKEEAKAFIASYRIGRKALLNDFFKIIKSKAKARLVLTADAGAQIKALIETLKETPHQGEVTDSVRRGFTDALSSLRLLFSETSFEAVRPLAEELVSTQDIFKSAFFAHDSLGRGAVILRLLRGKWIAKVSPTFFLELVEGVTLAMAKACSSEYQLKAFLGLCTDRDPKLLGANYTDDKDVWNAKNLRRVEAKFLPIFRFALATLARREDDIYEQVLAKLVEKGGETSTYSNLRELSAEKLREKTRQYVDVSLEPVRAAAKGQTAEDVVKFLSTNGEDELHGSSSLGRSLLRAIEEAESEASLPAVLQKEAIRQIAGDAAWGLGRRD